MCTYWENGGQMDSEDGYSVKNALKYRNDEIPVDLLESLVFSQILVCARLKYHHLFLLIGWQVLWIPVQCEMYINGPDSIINNQKIALCSH